MQGPSIRGAFLFAGTVSAGRAGDTVLLPMLARLVRALRRQRPAADIAAITARIRAGDAQAAGMLEEHLRLHPFDPQARLLRAQATLASGRLDRVVDDLEFALGVDPHDPVIRANLGLALWRSGQTAEARTHLEAAVAGDPVPVSAVLTLVGLRAAGGEMAGAAATLRVALAREPAGDRSELALAWITLAGLEPYVSDIDALDCLARARTLDPDSPLPDLLGYMPSAARCDWRQPVASLVAHFEKAAAVPYAASALPLPPAIADCLPVSKAARRAAARQFAAHVEARLGEIGMPAFVPRGVGSGRLRLGYLSADFHNHPTAQLLRGVLARHDRGGFEVHAYSYGPDDGSALRRELPGLFAHWHDLHGAGSRDIAARIAADHIDVLVDLKGYTALARPEIAAARPAPVQVNYLGHPGTLGARWIDYLIADRVLIPAGEEAWYDERIVFLPHSYQPNDDAQPVAATPTRAEAGLPDGAMVYCCFNTPYKIEPQVFAVWMDILRAVQGAVLWLLCDRHEARDNLRREAAARGVAADRLIFADSLPKASHLARLPLADLFLDTLFVNAHTTASDALWMGLPLLTVPGESFSARVASSVLAAGGLAELACADVDTYRARAVALGIDPQLRAALRQRARQARGSALFDTAAYTRALESAFLVMRERAAAGAAPASFGVDA